MKKIFFLLAFCHSLCKLDAQKINPSAIDIVRDSFGVPHIFAKTDAEVAYGLAYAHAEDDFKTIQLGFLAGKSMLGRYKGKEGATVDYIAKLLRCQQTANEKYATEISDDYKLVLEGYCDGFNAYARTFPGEILVKKLLPLKPQDIIAYSILQLAISSGADRALTQIYNGSIPVIENMKPGGSNAYAFNSQKTADGNAYLNINAHQPLDGPVSWYEAHLHSDEGWNIIGALFPCSPGILLGCNENLGWAHTVNHPDKLDVYQLEIDPSDKLKYKFDGDWLTLEEKEVKLHVKFLGIPISLKRKIYWSKYGPTIITSKGTFSIRTSALFEVRALEQWYRMNKATNFTSFYKALKMEALPGYNVMYADKFDTIFYLSNGRLPIREKRYNWRSTLPGNTSKTLWSQYYQLEKLPHYLNPTSGYLFNSNHSPFNASAKADNISRGDYDELMGYETTENNRSIRFMQLIAAHEKINYATFRKIKFDRELPKPLAYNINTDTLFLLDVSKHDQLKDVISLLQQWDRKATTDSKGATVFAVIYYFVVEQLGKGDSSYATLNKQNVINLFTYANDYLLKYFGSTSVSLGEYQKLVRGEKAIPLSGIPDVIASMESEPYKNGMVKGRQGESYIELVKFTKQGPQIESIHSYGASNKKGNKHFDDQMEMFEKQQLKQMTFEKESIYKNAEKIYHPQ